MEHHENRVAVRAALREFVPDLPEIFRCVAVFWIACGLLRPLTRDSLLADDDRPGESVVNEPAPLYPAFRNMLITVILLFAAYLVFEFRTLWFREFPPGFYYSGYSHEGAFWLTTALALTTLILSLIFRGQVLNDSRLPRLRLAAWIWSAENLLLAAAVYHRLMIYVGFNGMTRMRVVGFCGISAVIVGFLLVIWKITAGRDFVWLIRRQLWTLFFFVFLYAAMPVDALVMRYNVDRILAGDSAPSVQISVHPIDPDGLAMLTPLLDCDDETVREGVRALLAERYAEAKQRQKDHDYFGWTSFQAADRVFVDSQKARKSELAFPNDVTREAAWIEFKRYAYLWF